MSDEIKKLFDEKTNLYESDENKRRINIWGPEFSPDMVDMYSPGFISPCSSEKRKEKRIPITADWYRMQWSKFFNFNITTYYTDPIEYLKLTLKIDIFRFKNFEDDTPLLKTIPIFLGTAYEPSLFGVPVEYSPLHEPLFTSKGAIIKTEKDLLKLKIPDFYNDGLMPLAHKFYEEITKIAPNDYDVIFPKWGRGPFGIACAITGMENLLMLLLTNPKFVHEIMSIITNARIVYTKNRRNFLNRIDNESTLWNDDASLPIISPSMYEEFCFPYDNELSIFYGGLRWWHSCGNKTPFIPIIRRIKNKIDFIELNWWNDDLSRAIKDLNGEIAFIVRPATRDITEKNEAILRNFINSVLSLCDNENFGVMVDHWQPEHPDNADLSTMKRFLSICREEAEKKADQGKYYGLR
jgi:uroporphyrinogen-III decarboxylase